MNSLVTSLAEMFEAPDADKGWVIRQFEETALPDAARVLAQIAGAATEEDSLRTEALEALSHWSYRERDLHLEVGADVLEIAMSPLDELVRTHAIMALGRFVECPGVLSYLSQIVLDPGQTEDLRHNALESIRTNIDNAEALEVLRRAGELRDSVGRAAQRHFDS